jgi:hypothetical protein
MTRELEVRAKGSMKNRATLRNRQDRKQERKVKCLKE